MNGWLLVSVGSRTWILNLDIITACPELHFMPLWPGFEAWALHRSIPLTQPNCLAVICRKASPYRNLVIPYTNLLQVTLLNAIDYDTLQDGTKFKYLCLRTTYKNSDTGVSLYHDIRLRIDIQDTNDNCPVCVQILVSDWLITSHVT